MYTRRGFSFSIILRHIAAVLTTVSFLGGCSLPDLTPFAEATLELSEAVVSSGEAVTAALEENQMPKKAKDFSSSFQLRVDAMHAFVAYSDSLAAIAAEGKKGAESADQVATAFSHLVRYFDLLAPGIGSLSAAITTLTKESYKAVEQIRAARSMKAAVKEADPFVQELVPVIRADLSEMLRIVEGVAENEKAKIENCKLPHNPIDCEPLDTLKAKKEKYVKRAAKAESQLLSPSDCSTSPDELRAAASDWRALALEVDVRLQARNALVAEAKRQKKLRRRLLLKSDAGFERWAAVHHKLWKDLEGGTQPSVRNLVAVAEALRSLIEKVEAL